MRRSSELTLGSGPTFFAKTLNPYYLSRPTDTLLKVGVQLSQDLSSFVHIDTSDKLPLLIELNQKEPLRSIIKELCARWELKQPECFALQFTLRSHLYVNEENRTEIVNGDVLRLCASPETLSEVLIQWLRSSSNQTVDRALEILPNLSADATFAKTFLKFDGLKIVMDMIEKDAVSGDSLSNLLGVFQHLVENSDSSWTIPPDKLIEQIAGYVVGRTKLEHPKVLAVAMTILEAIINSSPRVALINEQVPFESLVRHLENSDTLVQHSVLALINALFLKVPESEHQNIASNPNNPVEDFQVVPPGLLAFDCISYFWRIHEEQFLKIILENISKTDGRECPLVQTGVLLVNVMMDVLHIGEQPSEQGQVYYEMFFTHESPFEEMFSCCIVLLNKTWKEMRASSYDDISKVLAVVREQIVRSLQASSRTFENFRKELKRHNYYEIAESWERERSLKEESDFQSPQIKEVRELLMPQMKELIKENRLSILKAGQVFAKYSTGSKGIREKGKSWFWKLCQTEQSFVYCDCNEKGSRDADKMEWKLPVSEIFDVVTGANCSYIKDSKTKKQGESLAFSIILKDDENAEKTFNFVAPDADTVFIAVF
ncbi:unnamed protein product [Soboliphyme baturini]|uniref:ELMO domain-containing protein n=1 Tax=Soboliphyme baturini TaxID=241478 RepID=A0A183IUN5_9BILA|nr:unnamed protein product [Soboliphyme baturini]